MKGNCWIWAWWIYYLIGRECVVLSWRGGFPHFGVEISPGLVMHFRRRRDRPHRRVPLWFEGELVCCKIKGDWAKQQVSWRHLIKTYRRSAMIWLNKADDALVFSKHDI